MPADSKHQIIIAHTHFSPESKIAWSRLSSSLTFSFSEIIVKFTDYFYFPSFYFLYLAISLSFNRQEDSHNIINSEKVGGILNKMMFGNLPLLVWIILVSDTMGYWSDFLCF